MMLSKSIFWLVGGGLLGFLAVLVGVNLVQSPYQYQGSVIDPPIPAAEFGLQTADGQYFRLMDQRGKVVLLFFGYTGCPDVCPTTLSEYKQIYQDLGEQARDVAFVFVTVDPDRDTPEKIAEYVGRFHPDFVGLSGTEEQLQPVWEGYFVSRIVEPHDPGEHYLVDHTARIYGIDKNGNLRLTFPFGLGPEVVAEDVRGLLAE